MKLRSFCWIHSFLFLIVYIGSADPWPSMMLTIAQLLFVPIILQLVKVKEDWIDRYYFYFALPAYLAVVILEWTDQTAIDGFLATIYLLFTIFIAFYGIRRFLQRGFTHLEEVAIDLGLVYIAIGGMWFVAYEASIDTGFSPLITWLTAIHFHYAAFLLPIFIGFLGRLYKPKSYQWITLILLISPFVVAIGITFSRWIELLSVLLFIVGIIGLLFIALRASFPSIWQKWLVCISLLALPVTIGFSLLYALGRVGSSFYVTIDFMLRFHGIMNCVIFGILGVIGWAIHVPNTKVRTLEFPVSQIRGVVSEKRLRTIVDQNRKVPGLVEHLKTYDAKIQSKSVIDFYEHTMDYRLFAQVHWRGWFKPFAAIYRIFSRWMKQLNLPFSNREVEMVGQIYPIKEQLDGRSAPRAWVRKVDDELVFVAIYSEHETKGRTFMNIALPLPLSSMIGILEVKQSEESVQLTSRGKTDSDAGIYLAFRKFLMKLPLEEDFHVSKRTDGELQAQHKMWIFGIPFLEIEYRIEKN